MSYQDTYRGIRRRPRSLPVYSHAANDISATASVDFPGVHFGGSNGSKAPAAAAGGGGGGADAAFGVGITKRRTKNQKDRLYQLRHSFSAESDKNGGAISGGGSIAEDNQNNSQSSFKSVGIEGAAAEYNDEKANDDHSLSSVQMLTMNEGETSFDRAHQPEPPQPPTIPARQQARKGATRPAPREIDGGMESIPENKDDDNVDGIQYSVPTSPSRTAMLQGRTTPPTTTGAVVAGSGGGGSRNHQNLRSGILASEGVKLFMSPPPKQPSGDGGGGDTKGEGSGGEQYGASYSSSLTGNRHRNNSHIEDEKDENVTAASTSTAGAKKSKRMRKMAKSVLWGMLSRNGNGGGTVVGVRNGVKSKSTGDAGGVGGKLDGSLGEKSSYFDQPPSSESAAEKTVRHVLSGRTEDNVGDRVDAEVMPPHVVGVSTGSFPASAATGPVEKAVLKKIPLASVTNVEVSSEMHQRIRRRRGRGARVRDENVFSSSSSSSGKGVTTAAEVVAASSVSDQRIERRRRRVQRSEGGKGDDSEEPSVDFPLPMTVGVSSVAQHRRQPTEKKRPGDHRPPKKSSISVFVDNNEENKDNGSDKEFRDFIDDLKREVACDHTELWTAFRDAFGHKPGTMDILLADEREGANKNDGSTHHQRLNLSTQKTMASIHRRLKDDGKRSRNFVAKSQLVSDSQRQKSELRRLRVPATQPEVTAAVPPVEPAFTSRVVSSSFPPSSSVAVALQSASASSSSFTKPSSPLSTLAEKRRVPSSHPVQRASVEGDYLSSPHKQQTPNRQQTPNHPRSSAKGRRRGGGGGGGGGPKLPPTPPTLRKGLSVGGGGGSVTKRTKRSPVKRQPSVDRATGVGGGAGATAVKFHSPQQRRRGGGGKSRREPPVRKLGSGGGPGSRSPNLGSGGGYGRVRLRPTALADRPTPQRLALEREGSSPAISVFGERIRLKKTPMKVSLPAPSPEKTNKDDGTVARRYSGNGSTGGNAENGGKSTTAEGASSNGIPSKTSTNTGRSNRSNATAGQMDDGKKVASSQMEERDEEDKVEATVAPAPPAQQTSSTPSWQRMDLKKTREHGTVPLERDGIRGHVRPAYSVPSSAPSSGQRRTGSKPAYVVNSASYTVALRRRTTRPPPPPPPQPDSSIVREGSSPSIAVFGERVQLKKTPMQNMPSTTESENLSVSSSKELVRQRTITAKWETNNDGTGPVAWSSSKKKELQRSFSTVDEEEINAEEGEEEDEVVEGDEEEEEDDGEVDDQEEIDSKEGDNEEDVGNEEELIVRKEDKDISFLFPYRVGDVVVAKDLKTALSDKEYESNDVNTFRLVNNEDGERDDKLGGLVLLLGHRHLLVAQSTVKSQIITLSFGGEEKLKMLWYAWKKEIRSLTLNGEATGADVLLSDGSSQQLHFSTAADSLSFAQAFYSNKTTGEKRQDDEEKRTAVPSGEVGSKPFGRTKSLSNDDVGRNQYSERLPRKYNQDLGQFTEDEKDLMLKFQRMKQIRIPTDVIIQKMNNEGVSERVIRALVGNDGERDLESFNKSEDQSNDAVIVSADVHNAKDDRGDTLSDGNVTKDNNVSRRRLSIESSPLSELQNLKNTEPGSNNSNTSKDRETVAPPPPSVLDPRSALLDAIRSRQAVTPKERNFLEAKDDENLDPRSAVLIDIKMGGKHTAKASGKDGKQHKKDDCNKGEATDNDDPRRAMLRAIQSRHKSKDDAVRETSPPSPPSRKQNDSGDPRTALLNAIKGRDNVDLGGVGVGVGGGVGDVDPRAAILNAIKNRKVGDSQIDSGKSGAVGQDQNSELTSGLTEDECKAVNKFQAMVKMQVPEDAVRHKMSLEGANELVVQAVFGRGTEGDACVGIAKPVDVDKPQSLTKMALTKLTEDEENVAAKYRKMLKMSVPKDAVRHKMTMDQVDRHILISVLGPDQEDEANENGDEDDDDPITLSQQEESVATKYRKMLKMRVPKAAVRHKMIQEQIDKRIMVVVLGREEGSKTQTNPGKRKSGGKKNVPKKKSGGPALVSLHWTPLSPKKLEKSIWAKKRMSKANETSLDPEYAEVKRLEELFRKKAAGTLTKKVVDDGCDGSGSSESRNVAKLIDLNRANNIAISLKAFKDFSLEGLAEAIGDLDAERRIVGERVQFIKSLLPNQKEVHAIQSYRGDDAALVPAELFFRHLLRVKRVEQKVHAMHTMVTFDECMGGLSHSFQLLTNACHQVMESEKLQRVMETVLRIGNIMNEGTRTGGAEGFKFESLLKLTQTKSTDGKMTVLDFLVMTFIARNEREVLQLTSEFPDSMGASKVLIGDLISDVKTLKASVKECEAELVNMKADQTEERERKTLAIMGGKKGNPVHSGMEGVGDVRSSLLAAISAQRLQDDHKDETSSDAAGIGDPRSALLASIKSRNSTAATTGATGSDGADPRSALLAAIKSHKKDDDPDKVFDSSKSLIQLKLGEAKFSPGVERLEEFKSCATAALSRLEEIQTNAVECCRDMAIFFGESGGEKAAAQILLVLSAFVSNLSAAEKKYDERERLERRKTAQAKRKKEEETPPRQVHCSDDSEDSEDREPTKKTPKRAPSRRTPKRTPSRRTPKRTPSRRTPKRTQSAKATPKRTPKRTPSSSHDDRSALLGAIASRAREGPKSKRRLRGDRSQSGGVQIRRGSATPKKRGKGLSSSARTPHKQYRIVDGDGGKTLHVETVMRTPI